MDPLIWLLGALLFAKVAGVFGYTGISGVILGGLHWIGAQFGFSGFVKPAAEVARKMLDLLPDLGGFGLD